MPVLRIVVAIAISLTVTRLDFVIHLALLRPRHLDLRQRLKIVPDIVRLLRSLAGDQSLPRGVRRRLGALLFYLALPIDLIPDFIPVLGYADEVIVVALVLRSVVRKAGPDALELHWQGTDDGLDLVRRLAGLDAQA